MGLGELFGGGNKNPQAESYATRAQQYVQEEEEEQDLAGVGIVFVRAPDNSLFVKSIIEGSGAQNSGIQVGDCLMKVEGRSVYCKGIETATKLILGPVGTMVKMKFGRIDRGKRYVYSQSLVRELKATSAPQWQINSANTMIEGITTSQLYLECMQNGQAQPGDPSATSLRTSSIRPGEGAWGGGSSEEASGGGSKRPSDEEDGGGGVFGGLAAGGSSCSSSGASRASREEGGEGDAAGAAKKKPRKILFKGKWYTEDQIAQMERVSRSLHKKLDQMEGTNASPGEAGGEAAGVGGGGGAAAAGGGEGSGGRAGGKAQAGPGFDQFRVKRVDQSPEALAAAIFVVQGGQLCKSWRSSKMGAERRTCFVKMSTGGMLAWGGKTAHAMRAAVLKDRYDPRMSKASYRDMGCKLEVVLEGDKVFAHSNDGGTVRAVEGRVLHFTADTAELADRWVTGIMAVLDMVKREAQERTRQARLIESTPKAGLAKSRSVFITAPLMPSFGVEGKEGSGEGKEGLGEGGPSSNASCNSEGTSTASMMSGAATLEEAAEGGASARSAGHEGEEEGGRRGLKGGTVLQMLEEAKEREEEAEGGGGGSRRGAAEAEAERRRMAEEERERREREERERAQREEGQRRERERKEKEEGERRDKEERQRQERERKEKEEGKRREKEERQRQEREDAARKAREETDKRAREKEEEVEEERRQSEIRSRKEAEIAREEARRAAPLPTADDYTPSEHSSDEEGEEGGGGGGGASAARGGGKGAAGDAAGVIPGLGTLRKSPGARQGPRDAPEPTEIDRAIALKPAAKKDRVSDETALKVTKNLITTARPGGNDLASLLAARKKKQQEAEENEDGYYFD